MKKPDVSIISSGATLADARLHRIANALTRDGLTVELFAPGSPSDAPDRVTLRNVHQGRGFLWRMHRALYSPWRANGRIIYCLAPEAQSFTWVAAIVKRRIYWVLGAGALQLILYIFTGFDLFGTGAWPGVMAIIFGLGKIIWNTARRLDDESDGSDGAVL